MEVKNKRDVPKIRFNIYRKKWKKKKFKDFTKLSQGLQIAISDRFTEDAETRHFYITNEFLNPNSRKIYYIESPSENVICTVDDILMTRTGNTGKVITNVSGAFHNNFFKVTYEKNDTAKLFLYYLLLSYDVQKEILIRAGNSTIPDLNHGDFYSIKTFIPIVEEQSAIGSLFRTLDDLLSSYKDNLANYQSLKATMLSKMFPKAGKIVPEIRLDGFEGEWEKLKLRDIVHTNPKSELPENFKYIDLESVVGTRINQIREECKESAPSRAQRLAKKGDVFYQTVRPYQKNNYLFKLDEIDYVFSTGYAQLRPIFKRCDSDFLLILLQNNRFLSKVLDRCTGTSYPAINVNDLIEILIAIPSYEEQQAIGAYFSNLDNLISAHQEKISQLETLKKKLLQDMFI